MMRSVLQLSIGIGIQVDWMMSNFSLAIVLQFSWISYYSSDCRCCHHEWGSQNGASTRALTSHEVTVAGRDREFASGNFVGIHSQTRRARWETKFEASLFQNLVNALINNLLTHEP